MSAKRNTIQKTLVKDAVHSMHCHPTAEKVYAKITLTHPSVSKGTVYRNLNTLADEGEIRRINVPNAADRFDFNMEPHYHIKCRFCEAFVDLDITYFNKVEEDITNMTGFVMPEHDIVFTGICPKCSIAVESK